MPADYVTALQCLKENLTLLTADSSGAVKREDMPIWNLSNALIVVCDALRHIEEKFGT